MIKGVSDDDVKRVGRTPAYIRLLQSETSDRVIKLLINIVKDPKQNQDNRTAAIEALLQGDRYSGYHRPSLMGNLDVLRAIEACAKMPRGGSSPYEEDRGVTAAETALSELKDVTEAAAAKRSISLGGLRGHNPGLPSEGTVPAPLVHR